jgi:hypothetical protein
VFCVRYWLRPKKQLTETVFCVRYWLRSKKQLTETDGVLFEVLAEAEETVD